MTTPMPRYSPNAVAEHAIALILAFNRHLHRAYNRVRDGNFSREGLVGVDLARKAAGIVGTGRIGALTGRLDYEAEAADSEAHHNKESKMDVVATFERVLDRTNEVIDRVEPEQLGNPTPCTEWDVRAVINHITGGATMFAECVEQGSVPDARLGELMGGDNLGDDFKGRYRAASDRARATFAMPGALDKLVKLPFGEMPAGVALNIAIMDVITHATDIAKATGQNIDDEEILTIALDVGHQLITDDFRRPGVFDAEQPAGPNASAADKLLAFAGRKV